MVRWRHENLLSVGPFDRVLPRARYRQYVVTFPRELRYLLATDRAFFSRALRTVLRTLFAWQRLRGRRFGLRGGQTGAVTFLHRFTQSLSLFPHAHCLLPDGLFVPGEEPDGELRFVPLPPPTDDDIAALTTRIAQRLLPLVRRQLEWAEQQQADADDEQHVARACVVEAMRNPAHPQSAESRGPAPPKPLTARVAGFSLHAARTVEPDDRAALERICSYGLRPPFSAERFSLAPDGRVRYELRKPLGPAGPSELLLEPLALLRRLAALLPAPRTHLVRYSGVFANRSRFRDRLPRPQPREVPPPGSLCPSDDPTSPVPEDAQTSDPPAEARPERPPRRRLPWAALLWRTMGLDAASCPKCAAPMVLLALITDPPVVARILRHLGMPTTPPRLAPARDPHDELLGDLAPSIDLCLDELPLDDPCRPDGQGRAPPNNRR